MTNVRRTLAIKVATPGGHNPLLSGNAGEMVLAALDSLDTMGLGSPVLEAMHAIILKLAPHSARWRHAAHDRSVGRGREEGRLAGDTTADAFGNAATKIDDAAAAADNLASNADDAAAGLDNIGGAAQQATQMLATATQGIILLTNEQLLWAIICLQEEWAGANDSRSKKRVACKHNATSSGHRDRRRTPRRSIE